MERAKMAGNGESLGFEAKLWAATRTRVRGLAHGAWADLILANPPFNASGWGGDSPRVRWYSIGLPPGQADW